MSSRNILKIIHDVDEATGDMRGGTKEEYAAAIHAAGYRQVPDEVITAYENPTKSKEIG